ncbi:hypothetical protein ACKVWE_002004 [Pyricularia oryzae]
MPTISFAPVYVPNASRKFRKAGDTPYMSIHSLVPHPAQIPSASEKHGAPQSHYSTTAHRPRGVPRVRTKAVPTRFQQWADHVLLSGPFGDCRAGTVFPVHVQLTNPRNGTTSSLQAIPEGVRG